LEHFADDSREGSCMENSSVRLDSRSQESLRKHIKEVKERHRLPSPPGVVTKVIGILKDPNFNARELSRFIADDPALAARTMSLSRSPQYAQRRQPRTVHEAVNLLGFQTVRNIAIATAAQSFLTRKSKLGDKIWTHSLAAALAATLLAKRVHFNDPEMAFLAGLLHDVGHMILFNGDPRGFERIIEEVQQSDEPLYLKEIELYRFDHTSVAFALLDYWNIDDQVNEAVRSHHNVSENRVGSLASIIDMADYICGKADLGFYGEAFQPDEVSLGAFGCADEESLIQIVEETRSAFDQENLLFREA
jgi:putative nucleotidyltransferase with HDIG domain